MAATAIFLSALLLFLIQPVMARQLLPRFGGSAGVWATSMLFFQAVLLAGYAYAHAALRYLDAGVVRWVHSFLAVAAIGILAAAPDPGFSGLAPGLEVLARLGAGGGLPCFLLASTTPLLQAWRGAGEPLPYRLYAVSNFASLAALLAYPFAIEPVLGLARQRSLWAWGFGLTAVLIVARLWTVVRAEKPAASERPQPKHLATWMALAALPSALWIAVANQLSQSVAAIPLLWIFPLALYLLAFTLVFQSDRWYRPALLRWLLPLAVLALLAGIRLHTWSRSAWAGLSVFGFGLFILCLFCLGELARRRPGAAQLTAYYLAIAAGGAFGGAAVSMVAPVVLNDYYELPGAIVACVLLAMVLLYGYRSRAQVMRLALVTLGATAYAVLSGPSQAAKSRNFYGTLEVRDAGQGEAALRELVNGTILHGSQFLAAPYRGIATTYYGTNSGIGRALDGLPGSRRAGLIGLGVGTLARYSRQGDVFRFYEINPAVIEAATSRFTFLKDAPGRIEIVPGDARLSLESEPPQRYNLLAVDAFAGDSIPVHLLTREAFALYFRHLAPDGILALHVTSKYYDLTPVISNLAAAAGRKVEFIRSPANPRHDAKSAVWALVRGSTNGSPAGAVWTDDYSNLVSILK